MSAKEERKIILDLAVTLDGLIEGPNGEVDWCIMDEEMDFPKFLDGIDTILYGRKSFDAWGQYSPESESAVQLIYRSKNEGWKPNGSWLCNADGTSTQ